MVRAGLLGGTKPTTTVQAKSLKELPNVCERVDRSLACIHSNRMVRRGGRDVPIPSFPLALEISSMDLIARLSHLSLALAELSDEPWISDGPERAIGPMCFRFVLGYG